MTTERTGPLEPFVYNGQSRDQIPENVEHLIVDSSVEEIPLIAFEDFCSLAKVEIKSGVQAIGQMAFSGCNNLTEVVIPCTVDQIEIGAFNECEDLQKVVLPMGLTQIGDLAFGRCRTLTEIIIPSTVTNFEWEVFDECDNLQSIDIKGGDNLPLAIRLSTEYPTKTPNITMSFLVSQYFFHRITALDLLEPHGCDDIETQLCKKWEGKKVEEIKSAFVEHLRLLVEWRVCSGNFIAITNRKRKAED